MGGKTVNISLAGAASAAVTLTRSGMTTLKDVARALSSSTIDELLLFFSNASLTLNQQRYLYHIKRFSHVLRGEFNKAGNLESGFHYMPALIEAERSGKLTYTVIKVATNGVKDIRIGDVTKSFFPDWVTTADIDTMMKVFVYKSRIIDSRGLREMTYKGLLVRGYVNDTYQVTSTIFPAGSL